MTHSPIVALNNRIEQRPLGLSMCLDCGQVFDSNQFGEMETNNARRARHETGCVPRDPQSPKVASSSLLRKIARAG
jgi:hypothetical protein